ncbi:hypothetical protein [Caulobacter sp.]|uniref:hypothetical protein n=1 Tax=Caulobacter sp. TaxID=78 RepID=UPI003BAC3578
MLKTFTAIRDEAHAHREWFEVVGQSLVTQAVPQSVFALASTFCASGAELDGRPVTQSDCNVVVAALVQSLKVFEDCKLISGTEEVRFTERLRLPVSERAAQLTSRGRAILALPHWQIEFLFQRHLIAKLIRGAWKPFAGAVAVASTVAGVLKLILLWRSEQAAVTGALVGAAMLIGHLWQHRR